MRRAAKVDANQGEIVAALRKAGASVTSLAAVGDGVPDLLVGFRGATYLLEVKDGSAIPSKQRLTKAQTAWHEAWKGAPIHIIRCVDTALMTLKCWRPDWDR